MIRLPIELSKNKKGLTIPLSGRLLVLVESAWNNRSIFCPYLFHHKGEPIGDFRKAFDAACAAAGLQGIVPHDLRRSAVRNFIRAGVKESVAMRLSGHRTRSVFDRYNIVSEDDLIDASTKLQQFLVEAIKDDKGCSHKEVVLLSASGVERAQLRTKLKGSASSCRRPLPIPFRSPLA